MSRLLILGAGGHALVAAETAIACCLATSIVFLDDHFLRIGPYSVLDSPVIGPLDLSLEPDIYSQFDGAVVAIGHATTRLFWIDKLQSAGFYLPVLKHPTSCISSSARIGPASVVFAHAVVQSQASIGIGAILNTACSVDHDSKLSDGVHVCPGARLGGEVKVGARSWIGIGSSVIQRVCIGSDVTVGAGAAVVSDLPNGATAVGVPARVSFPT